MDYREPAVSAGERSWISIIVFVASVLVTCPAVAQVPLAEVVPRMLGPDMTIAPGSGGTHALDFARNLGEPDLVPAPFGPGGLTTTEPRGFVFNTGIVEQLTTFPIGSSSGGFVYGFDPSVGTFTRSTRSFGPSFADRPLTSGRRTISIGFSAQNVEYERFDGTPLDGDAVRFHYVHRDLVDTCNPDLVFTPCSVPPLTPERSDVIEATVRLRIRSRTTATTLTFGVTDQLDLGMTIPMVTTTLEARVDKRILRLGTATNPAIHSFDGFGADTATATGGGTASGVGDLRIQAKYNLHRGRFLATAAMWDVRLPTGDSRNLLGTGAVVTRVLGIISAGTRVFSPHANVGVTLARKNVETLSLTGQPDNEFNYTFGFDWSIVARATVSADILGRRGLNDLVRMSPAERTLTYVRTAGGPIQTQNVTEFRAVDFFNRDVVHGVVGGKFGPWRTMLLVGNLLFPVTDVGLRNKPALSVGLEYTF